MQAIDAEKISRIAAECTALAVGRGSWTGLCDLVADLVGGVGAAIVPVRPTGAVPGFPASASLAALIEDYFGGGWNGRDPRLGCRAALTTRGYATDADGVAPEAMAREPLYRDLLARHDIGRFLAVRLDVNGDLWALCVQAPSGRGPFEAGEIERLVAVAPPVEAALRQAAAEGADRLAQWRAAFEAGGRAVVALDHSGQAVAVSDDAGAVFYPALAVVDGRLRSADAIIDARLEALASGAARRVPGTPLPAPVAVQHGAATLVVDALPMPKDLQSLLTNVAALLLIRPTQDDAGGLLRTSYGLTPAETRLALALAGSGNLALSARSLNIAVGTARAYLKSIFDKTGTHRQGELISLVMRVAA